MDISSVISSGGGGGGGRNMHQPPSLAEAPLGSGPRPDEPRSSQYSIPGANTGTRSPSPGPGDDGAGGFGPDRIREPLPSRRTQSMSPPRRRDTYSSASGTGENARQSRGPSAETTSNGYGLAEVSPTNQASQGVFPVNGSDSSQSRRANRRRTGPLSADQRERAAIIRKLGACSDCRRRRVAVSMKREMGNWLNGCNPNHHNMSWDEARRRYRSHSQDLQEPIPISSDRAFQPVNGNYTYEPQGMDLDQSPTSQQTVQSSSTDAQARTIRTPLPSGPRLERTAQAVMSLPGIDTFRSDLQGHASSIIANPTRSRYSAVYALLLVWEDEKNDAVKQSVEELRSVLDRHYHYTFDVDAIPSDEPERSWRWLSRRMDQFMGTNDQRDVLKILYYNGRTLLDGNRAMVLARWLSASTASTIGRNMFMGIDTNLEPLDAMLHDGVPSADKHVSSSTESEQPRTIRWSAVQPFLEQAIADTLVIMDAKYFGVPTAARRRGTLEVIAAGTFEEQAANPLARCAFTQALSQNLRTRAARTKPFSAADLHAQLLAEYPKIVQELSCDRELLTNFPAPLHLQLADSHNVPSILIAPLQRSRPPSIESVASSSSPGAQLSLTLRLDREPDADCWAEWLRLMPDGVRDVKVEGSFRSALR
ncbi:hypothetical protein diail_2857 [Diaporthe ilicicola]|nr:hypothetical protein diail_2857 [Diaporthe ilicicola]